MGKENETKKRLKVFKKYQINKNLLRFSNKNSIVMHCLPARRGLEITNDIIDSKNSIIWTQSENRLHMQKAIILKLLKL